MIVVTPILTAIATVMFLIMALDVVRLRRKYAVALQGLGGNKHLNRAIRIHGNFTEYAPLSLFLLYLVESDGNSTVPVAILGAALLVGRVLHWIGLKMTSGPSIFRTGGVGLTMLVMIACAGILGVRGVAPL